MQRINVVGTSGSGKSTFAKSLALALSAPYIEMDSLHWGPNWTPVPEADFHARLRNSLSAEAWVLDGNYSVTKAIKWERATTVIWLDYPLPLILYQVAKRAIARALSKRELWAGTGNVETFKKSFFEKDSIILWALTSHRRNQEHYQAAMKDPKYSSIIFVRLKSPLEAKDYLASIIP